VCASLAHSLSLSNIFQALTVQISLALHSKHCTNHNSTPQALTDQYTLPLAHSLPNMLQALTAHLSLSLCTRSTLQITAAPRSLALSLHIHIYIYTCVHTLVCASLSLLQQKELTTHLTWLSLMCTRISGPRDAFGASPHARTGWGPVGRAKILRGVAVLLVCASLARSVSFSLCKYIYIYIRMHTYIYAYIYTYIYTHMYITHLAECQAALLDA